MDGQSGSPKSQVSLKWGSFYGGQSRNHKMLRSNLSMQLMRAIITSLQFRIRFWMGMVYWCPSRGALCFVTFPDFKTGPPKPNPTHG